jgi:hypothetical protein
VLYVCDVDEWLDQLRTVSELNSKADPASAEAALAHLIGASPDAVMTVLNSEIEVAVNSFLPKRRARLQLLHSLRIAQGPEQTMDEPGNSDGWSSGSSGFEFQPSSSVSEALAEIAQLLRDVKPTEAEERTRRLMDRLTPFERRRHEHEIRAQTSRLLPKRQRLLDSYFDQRLQAIDRIPEDLEGPSAIEMQTNVDSDSTLLTTGPIASPSLVRGGQQLGNGKQPGLPKHHIGSGVVSRTLVTHNRFQSDLEELSRSHIFQWATYYRDTLADYFDVFLDELISGNGSAALNTVRSCLSSHSREIFHKGYVHVTGAFGDEKNYAVTKSMAGLQRFLDLPLEFYSSYLQANHNLHAGELRKLCSAMICGILQGYSAAQLDQRGSKILPRFQRLWAHVLPFLTTADLDELTPELEAGEFVDGINSSLRPFVAAIDHMAETEPEAAPMPALSQYLFATRRLDVSLQLPPSRGSRTLDVQCYISVQFVTADLLEEASARAIDIVVAPLGSDLRARVESVERWSSRVVPVLGREEVDPTKRLLARLEDLVDETGDDSLSRPITFNYVQTFPLENPFLTKYNHVYRSSVRRLMQSHERRNGVRLWCSIRRSGKTTACTTDLGSSSGQSIVVSQTCESTGQIPGGDVFYSEIRRALEAGRRLDDNFVETAVAKCVSSGGTSDSRVVLVLDEYETLFGDLRSSLRPRPELRYTVIQPLLNQLVAFARDNLLIFMGQQPNAHFILLDQNQLSPVVEQDSFPLFPHDSNAPQTGEFYELMAKVMTAHVELEPGFVSAVYRETAGHPFLTVKLMLTFMDWLIVKRHLMSELSPIRLGLFEEFLDTELRLARIAQNRHFAFFRYAAAEHLSPDGRREEPWLHSVYSALRLIGLSSPRTLAVPMGDFSRALTRSGGEIAAYDLLATASRANFLTMGDDELVRARIPLLARIAAAVTPR